MKKDINVICTETICRTVAQPCGTTSPACLNPDAGLLINDDSTQVVPAGATDDVDFASEFVFGSGVTADATLGDIGLSVAAAYLVAWSMTFSVPLGEVAGTVTIRAILDGVPVPGLEVSVPLVAGTIGVDVTRQAQTLLGIGPGVLELQVVNDSNAPVTIVRVMLAAGACLGTP